MQWVIILRCRSTLINAMAANFVQLSVRILRLKFGEKTNKFKGRYFILGAIHKTGILEEWQKLRLENLKKYLRKDQAEEIILAFNPTSQGDYNASLIAKELKPFAKKISRLGRGLPVGGEIEFADDETLGSALERRS